MKFFSVVNSVRIIIEKKIAWFDKEKGKFIYYDKKGNEISKKNKRTYWYSWKFEYDLNIWDVFKNKYNSWVREIVDISPDWLDITRTDWLNNNHCKRSTFISKVDVNYNLRNKTINPRHKRRR